MTIATRWAPVLTRLDQYRAVLLGKVADELFYTIPLLGVPMDAADPGAIHQGQMMETAARLHDALQITRLHEQLLTDEFAWGGRVLPHWGVTADHVEQLIDCYLEIARSLGAWDDSELVILGEIGIALRRLTRDSFATIARLTSVETTASGAV